MNLLEKVERALGAMDVGCTKEAAEQLQEMRRYLQANQQANIDEDRIARAVKTLTYTEGQAIQAILPELENGCGLVVASKIADRHEFTRSVVVNALRKFESAGVIESRSLGMKGTMITAKVSGWADKVAEKLTA